VDPSSHDMNRPVVFGGPAFGWVTQPAERDAEALEAVRRFIEEFGIEPSQVSWVATGMKPCEKTIPKPVRQLPSAPCE